MYKYNCQLHYTIPCDIFLPVTPDVLQYIDRICRENTDLCIGKTLEIGSMDVNGSVSHHFSDYTGLDMRPGPNVDIVSNGHDIPFPNEHFDLVLILETLEHDNRFWVTLLEVWRILKPSGMAIITVPNIGFQRHDYPSDYWRFTADGLKELFMWADLTPVEIVDMGYAVFGRAIKNQWG